MGFFWTIVVLLVLLALAWRYLGAYMVGVFEGRIHFLGFIERPIYRMLGTSPDKEQTWKRYAGSVVVFSGLSIGITYAILRLQGSLPWNPQHFGAVGSPLAWNTATSFVTNTNWQNYGGETTMSYLSQMCALTVQQFVTPAVGIGAALVIIRGFSKKGSPTVGNFWVDMTRALLYVLVPIATIAGLIFVGQGAVDTLGGPVNIHNSLNGVSQTIAVGPVGFMEAIKQLGTNGGGFFNINSAHPFENPTGLTNFLSMFLLLCIPVSLTYVFGKMVGSIRQGVAVLAAMFILFGAWTAVSATFETQANPAVQQAGLLHQPTGNTTGKEVRFGVPTSALFGVSSTSTSTGSADSAYDSFTPIGGGMNLTGMMLGEVTPGGVGSGMYTILIYAIIAVFLGGLMVGRTPEYLGKKIQATEVKLAGLGTLVMPITVLAITGIAVSLHAGRAGPLNAGPHGFTEILYALTSQGNNNGSAFGGLTGNTTFYNILGGIDMLIGRFGIMIPAIALGGVLAAKNVVPAGAGTFRTDNPMFVGLLIGVIVIVGGLTFFPAVSLGPIVEQLSHGKFF
ncbi:MAG TPA: potassium-transporting ATPase subunit KdpA [Acidimicrobiales bacterium]|jgi:K+-transporting ATPase ATPase A chain|nr:potassium-transporting ATPase subunit KdpA [Acidimicrobiales bacterium]